MKNVKDGKETRKARKRPTGSKRTRSTEVSTSSTARTLKWIRIDRPLPLPAYVREALQKLDDAGHLAYVVGGSVRDFLLGRELRQIKDHDIATSARPEELEALFPTAIEVGKAFGVLKVPVPNGAGSEFLEIATFRQDLDYRDHRHPTGILIAGPYEDAQRRDFTVNALFYDPKAMRILDTVEGLEDLKARRLRAIGVPKARFREDALRLLRAVRFSASLDFTIEEKTEAAIRDSAKLVNKVSAERIHAELSGMLQGPRPVQALQTLEELGLRAHVLPELDALKAFGGSWKLTLQVVRSLARSEPKPVEALRWAALFLRAGQSAWLEKGGTQSAPGYEIESSRIWVRAAERLKFSRDEMDRVKALIESQLKFRDVFQMREATLQRLVRHPDFEAMLELHRAEATATDGNLAYYDFCRARLEEFRRQGAGAGELKLLGGEDLIELGLQPGPRFSEILRAVEDLALERKLTTKNEALNYVLTHFVR